MHNQDEMLRDILLELIELRQENKKLSIMSPIVKTTK